MYNKTDKKYKCNFDDEKPYCAEHYGESGYSIETCKNVCTPEYFDDMLPRITISKNPLNNIVFGLGKWLGISPGDEYLKYPFDDKYVHMTKKVRHKQPQYNMLLNEFLDFIQGPNIYIMSRFIIKYNHFMTMPVLYNKIASAPLYDNMDLIKFDAIAFVTAKDLDEPIFENIDLPDSGPHKKYNFFQYLKDEAASELEILKYEINMLVDTNPEISRAAILAYSGTYITDIAPVHGTYSETIRKILFALNKTNKFSAIQVYYNNISPHANTLIFDSDKNKIYYVEPHGDKKSRIRIFIKAFDKCFLQDKFRNWSIEFIDHRIQDDDLFCMSWSTISMLTISKNNSYYYDSILLLFGGLQHGINIISIWYFSIFKKLDNMLRESIGNKPLKEYIMTHISENPNGELDSDNNMPQYASDVSIIKILTDILNIGIRGATTTFGIKTDGSVSQNSNYQMRINRTKELATEIHKTANPYLYK
jgi:hypothetical protein